jgi:uncharacterized protein YndB with AHSA1/START domain
MTSKPASEVTADNDAVITEIEIAAPPDRVFEAITNREQALRWGGGEQFEILRWEMDVRPGGKWNFASRARNGNHPPGVDRFEHHGEFLEVEWPRLLVQTWYANWHPIPSQRTVVRWELTPTKTGTRLKVTHSGLAPLAGVAQGYSEGWPGLVQQIKTFVEKLIEDQMKPASVVTPDNDAVVSEVHIAAPVERVFQALIDRKQVMQWWNDNNCFIEDFAIDPRRGGKWRYDTKQGELVVNGVSKFHCEGEVLEYDPPRVVAYTWIANWHDDKSRRTVVRWELTPAGNGTRLKVTHSGLAQEATARKDYSGGWPGVLAKVKEFVEG